MFRLQQTRSIFLLAKAGPTCTKTLNVPHLKQAFRPFNVNLTKILSNGSRSPLTRYLFFFKKNRSYNLQKSCI